VGTDSLQNPPPSASQRRNVDGESAYFQTKSADRYVPHFIGIGAQKSATTWLDSALRRHPLICLPARRKEIHFFDANYWKGHHWYLWHFRGGEDKFRGEITPGYSILDEGVIERVKHMNPNLKIVLLMRNPIGRAWSMAVMDLLKWKEGSLTRQNIERVKRHFREEKSIRRGSYTHILERW
jgi:hypothetical protein